MTCFTSNNQVIHFKIASMTIISCVVFNAHYKVRLCDFL